MTCRDEVLVALEASCRQTGRIDFTPSEVLASMRAAGSSQKDATVRTLVSSHLIDEGSLVRSSPGRYGWIRYRDRRAEARAISAVDDGDRVSEDAVKPAVAAALEGEGWTVGIRWRRAEEVG